MKSFYVCVIYRRHAHHNEIRAYRQPSNCPKRCLRKCLAFVYAPSRNEAVKLYTSGALGKRP